MKLELKIGGGRYFSKKIAAFLNLILTECVASCRIVFDRRLRYEKPEAASQYTRRRCELQALLAECCLVSIVLRTLLVLNM